MSLELIIGCMYSGKSSELVKRVTRLQTIQQSYLIYNSVIDTRYGTSGIYTHNKNHIPCSVTDSLLSQVNTESFKTSHTIFIDEAQFFSDLYEFVVEAVERHHKHVVVIGLDGDSDRQNFGQIHTLLPLADDITKLKALCLKCSDGTPGIFSKKVIDSTHSTHSTNQVDIGSTDKYIAVCRKCYAS